MQKTLTNTEFARAFVTNAAYFDGKNLRWSETTERGKKGYILGGSAKYVESIGGQEGLDALKSFKEHHDQQEIVADMRPIRNKARLLAHAYPVALVYTQNRRNNVKSKRRRASKIARKSRVGA